MKRCKDQKKDLHMVFIDLEMAYDKVPRNDMWWALWSRMLCDPMMPLKLKSKFYRTQTQPSCCMEQNVGLLKGDMSIS
jgi:hypothetical protein